MATIWTIGHGPVDMDHSHTNPFPFCRIGWAGHWWSGPLGMGCDGMQVALDMTGSAGLGHYWTGASWWRKQTSPALVLSFQVQVLGPWLDDGDSVGFGDAGHALV